MNSILSKSEFVLSTAGHFNEYTRLHFHLRCWLHFLWKWYRYPLCTSLGYLNGFSSLVSISSIDFDDMVGRQGRRKNEQPPLNQYERRVTTERLNRRKPDRGGTDESGARSAKQTSGGPQTYNYYGLWSVVDCIL